MSYNYTGIVNTTATRSKILQPFCYWNNAFNESEIKELETILTKVPLTNSMVSGGPSGIVDNSVRRSKVSFHNPNDENQWVFDRFNAIIENLNYRFWNFDINGYDGIQYSEYHSNDNGKYDWHLDTYIGLMPDHEHETRKLSLVLWLNDDYEGGDFELATLSFNDPVVIPKEKGKMILFPSFLFHRVTPVTKGVRKSIVAWVLGPKFR